MKKLIYTLGFIGCCFTAYGTDSSEENIVILFVTDHEHAYVKKGDDIAHVRSMTKLDPALNGKRFKARLAKRNSAVIMTPVSKGDSCKNSNEKKYTILSVSPDKKHVSVVDEKGDHFFTRASIKLDQAHTGTDLCVHDIPQRLVYFMSPVPVEGKTSEKVTVVSIEPDAHVRVKDKEGNLIDYKLSSGNDDALHRLDTGLDFYLPPQQYERYAISAFTGTH